LCTDEAPALFDIADGDGLSYALVDDVPREWEEAAVRAQVACPTAAITVESS
jgi:ferredoxin